WPASRRLRRARARDPTRRSPQRFVGAARAATLPRTPSNPSERAPQPAFRRPGTRAPRRRRAPLRTAPRATSRASGRVTSSRSECTTITARGSGLSRPPAAARTLFHADRGDGVRGVKRDQRVFDEALDAHEAQMVGPRRVALRVDDADANVNE